MYTIKIVSNLENNDSVVLYVLFGRMSTYSVINLDLASAKKTDNQNTSTSVRNASRTIACGREEDKKRETFILQRD